MRALTGQVYSFGYQHLARPELSHACDPQVFWEDRVAPNVVEFPRRVEGPLQAPPELQPSERRRNRLNLFWEDGESSHDNEDG